MTNQANSFMCRECRQYFSEESGAEEDFVCENCIIDLEFMIDLDSNKKDEFIASQEGHKQQWIKAVYESEKADYIQYGHKDESYHEFLSVTYDATLESMGIENLDADIKDWSDKQ